MGNKSKQLQKHWKKLLIVVFCAGLAIGLPLALIPTGTFWGIDSRDYGVRYENVTYQSTLVDPDDLGIAYDVPTLPNYPVVVSALPQVRFDYGGIRHVDSDGNPTPYDVPDREWTSGDRKYSVHYYELETVIRTEAKQVSGYTSLITTFTFVENARVTVAPMVRVILQGNEGEDLGSEFGGCTVVAVDSVLYNPDFEQYTYAGQFDTPHHVSMPTLNSRVNVMTETDEPDRKVYVMYKECSLQAGAAYLYNQFNIVYGLPRVVNVGVHQVWRFAFTLDRALTAEEILGLDPVLDDDPAMPPPPIVEKAIVYIIGFVILGVIIYIVVYYIRHKAQQSTSVKVSAVNVGG